jgi:hypothetical protein
MAWYLVKHRENLLYFYHQHGSYCVFLPVSLTAAGFDGLPLSLYFLLLIDTNLYQ